MPLVSRLRQDQESRPSLVGGLQNAKKGHLGASYPQEWTAFITYNDVVQELIRIHEWRF